MISAIWQADERDTQIRYAGTQNPERLQQEAIDTTITSSIGQFGRRVAKWVFKIAWELISWR